MTLVGHAKSATSLVFITANLVFWLVLAIPTSLLRDLVPPFAPTARRWLDGFYRGAVRVDDFWLRRVIGLRWSMPAVLDFDRGRGRGREQSWIVLSNHVSWSDIFLLQSLLVRHGLVVQFLSKRELLLVPVVGLVLWAFQFPLLRRTARRGESDELRKRGDFEALRAACRRARENPVALVCFAEGTRATPQRRALRGGPHRHLLPPRVGGFGALCDGLGDSLAGVVDCTLVYPPAAGSPAPTNAISFWSFLSGDVGAKSVQGRSGARGGSRAIEVAAELVAAAEIPGDRDERMRWLEARWLRKDALIDARLAAATTAAATTAAAD